MATPLQLASLYACIANDGGYQKAMLIEGLVDDEGNLLEEAEIQPPLQAMSVSTAHTIQRFLIQTVEEGSGRQCESQREAQRRAKQQPRRPVGMTGNGKFCTPGLRGIFPRRSQNMRLLCSRRMAPPVQRTRAGIQRDCAGNQPDESPGALTKGLWQNAKHFATSPFSKSLFLPSRMANFGMKIAGGYTLARLYSRPKPRLFLAGLQGKAFCHSPFAVRCRSIFILSSASARCGSKGNRRKLRKNPPI